MAGFVGRERELDSLRRELRRDRPSVVVVFGRRRVGKSRLLLEATKGFPSIYYQATRVAGSMSLDLFKAEATQLIGPDAVLDSVGDWQGVLAYLEQVARERMPGLTVVLDEFPYLCDSDPSLPSVFQKVCDGIRERRSPLNLVLCGSKVAFMEELLGEKNPMHGRQTRELDLAALPYRDAVQFFPHWSDDEKLQAYGIFGGVPYYLSLCDPHLSLEENVKALILETGAPLADEPNTLLQAELRDVTRYATILRAIADGCTDSGKIVGRVREIPNASTLSPYVRTLEQLRLIRIIRSLDATERERDRRYFLDDPFLAFWYRFYLPNASALAAGHSEAVWAHAIEPHLVDYMGGLFEWICRDYVRLYGEEVLPVAAREVGQIWNADFDIDVAGTLFDGSTLGGECKWWTTPVGVSVIERLRGNSRKTAYFTASGADRLLVVSRSGFTSEAHLLERNDSQLRLIRAAELLGSNEVE